jgi:hypothetical protein
MFTDSDDAGQEVLGECDDLLTSRLYGKPQPIALVTATNVESRGFPVADRARGRGSPAQPSLFRDLGDPASWSIVSPHYHLNSRAKFLCGCADAAC